MSTPDKISPAEALERLFAVIREEATASPTFARRMLDAVGANVALPFGDAKRHIAFAPQVAVRVEHARREESGQLAVEEFPILGAG